MATNSIPPDAPLKRVGSTLTSGSFENKRFKASGSEEPPQSSCEATMPWTMPHLARGGAIEVFCQACSSIKRPMATAVTIPRFPNSAKELMRLANEPDCPFCVFLGEFSEALRKLLPQFNGPYCLYALSMKEALGLAKIDSVEDSAIFAVVPRDGIDSKSKQLTEYLFRHNGYFMDLPPIVSGVAARQISPQVDFQMAKDWLTFCKAHHKDNCRTEILPPLSGFKVIDCATRQLVRWTDPTQVKLYLTLSYVWGTDEVGPLQDSGILSSKLPQLIEDALEVTRKLGFRYIWIDRYCVPQDDDAAKHILIRNMDQIYSNSHLTIIASGGTSPREGLPGVSGPRTEDQKILKLGNRTLVQMLTNVADAIQQSYWNTRGWTYQEALLCQRKLVFTASQCYFQCSGMWCTEGLLYPLEELHTTDLQQFRATQYSDFGQLHTVGPRQLPRAFPVLKIKERPEKLIEQMEEYSYRQFTFDRDALDAFRGVLNHAMDSGKGTLKGHLCGLPLWHSPSCQQSLFHVLQWMQDHSREGKTLPILPKRRHEPPSWSWVGWQFSPLSKYGFFLDSSPVRAHGRYIATTVIDEVMRRTKVIAKFDDGSMIDWSREALDLTMSGRNARFLYVKGWVTTINIPETDVALFKERNDFRVGPYLLWYSIISRLRQIATERNLSKKKNQYSLSSYPLTCWVMGSPGHVFVFMALVLLPDGITYERLDVFTVKCPRVQRLDLFETARILGWEEKDIKIG